jgi:hypothetical protein
VLRRADFPVDSDPDFGLYDWFASLPDPVDDWSGLLEGLGSPEDGFCNGLEGRGRLVLQRPGSPED